MSITYNGKSVLAIYRNGTAVEQALIAWNWTPRQMYFGGVQGAAYAPDPNDVYGNSGLAAFGEGVSAVLDEKNNTPVLGPELVTNGDFSSGTTGWQGFVATIAVNGGKLEVTPTDTSSRSGYQTISTVAGKVYSVTGEYNQNTTTGVLIRVRQNAVNSTILYTSSTFTGVGTFTFLFAATTTVSVLELATSTSNSSNTAIFDNISVREISGIHALQPSATLRPLLGRAPIAGRRNQLTFTEQFENAAWIRSGVQTIATGVIAPDNQPTANQLIEGTGTINGASIRSINFFWLGAGSLVAAASVYAKEVVGSAKRYLVFGVFFVNSRWGYVVVDLATGTVTRTSVDGIQTSIVSGSVSVQPVANGYYRVSIAVLSPLAGNSHYLRIGLSNTPTPTFTTADIPSYTGDGTSSIAIWGAQVEISSTISSYQKVGSNVNDVTETGVPSYPYIRMDLSDDVLTTSAPSQKNLLRATEEPDNALWAKTGMVVAAGSSVLPFTSTSRVYQTFAVGSSVLNRTYTASVTLSSPSKAKIAFRLQGAATTTADATFVQINLTSTPTRYSVTRTFTSNDTSISVGLDNRITFGGDEIAGDVVATQFQLETGNTATSYEYGGFQGDVLVSGRSGSTYTSNVKIPDGNFSLGPASYTGGVPGILRSIGDVVGYNLIGKTLTPKERRYLIEYYKDRGAKGELVVGGPELVSAASSWTGSATWSVNTSTGTATVSSASSSGDDLSIGSLISEIGKYYLASFTIQSVTGGTVRVNGSRVVTGAGLSLPGTYTSVMSVTIAGTGSLTIDVSAGGVSAVVTNISVKELRPIEEWV